MYVVKCLVKILTYRHTLDHTLVINFIIVIYLVKDLVRSVLASILWKSTISFSSRMLVKKRLLIRYKIIPWNVFIGQDNVVTYYKFWTLTWILTRCFISHIATKKRVNKWGDLILIWLVETFKMTSLFCRCMVLNATFNSISVMLWRSVSLVEKTGLPWKSHRLATSHWQTLSHNVVSSTAMNKLFLS